MCYWQKQFNSRIPLQITWRNLKISHFVVRRTNIFLKSGRSINFNILFIISFISTMLGFFHSVGKISDSTEKEKSKYNVSHIASSQIFDVRKLIRSRTCALLTTNFLITLKVSSLVKFIVFKDLFVLHKILVGKLLPVLIRVHWFAKNEFFSLRSTTNCWLRIERDKQGIFLLLI